MLDEKMLGWRICETKSLIDYIINNKTKPLSQNFFIWAKRNGRGAFSVRNYFYKFVALLKNDEKVKNKLGLTNDDLFFLTHSSHFSVGEEIWLVKNVLCLSLNMSVRHACLKISKGDKGVMVRNQNKFRKIIKTKKEFVEKIMEDLKNENISFKNPYEEKVIKMPKEKTLSKEDVNSLFFGLLKLVREEVKEEIKEDVNFEKKELLNKIRLHQVKEKCLEEENKKLKLVICETEKEIENIGKSDNKKMEKLKSFIKSLTTKKEEIDEQNNDF